MTGDTTSLITMNGASKTNRFADATPTNDPPMAHKRGSAHEKDAKGSSTDVKAGGEVNSPSGLQARTTTCSTREVQSGTMKSGRSCAKADDKTRSPRYTLDGAEADRNGNVTLNNNINGHEERAEIKEVQIKRFVMPMGSYDDLVKDDSDDDSDGSSLRAPEWLRRSTLPAISEVSEAMGSTHDDKRLSGVRESAGGRPIDHVNSISELNENSHKNDSHSRKNDNKKPRRSSQKSKGKQLSLRGKGNKMRQPKTTTLETSSIRVFDGPVSFYTDGTAIFENKPGMFMDSQGRPIMMTSLDAEPVSIKGRSLLPDFADDHDADVDETLAERGWMELDIHPDCRLETLPVNVGIVEGTAMSGTPRQLYPSQEPVSPVDSDASTVESPPVRIVGSSTSESSGHSEADIDTPIATRIFTEDSIRLSHIPDITSCLLERDGDEPEEVKDELTEAPVIFSPLAGIKTNQERRRPRTLSRGRGKRAGIKLSRRELTEEREEDHSQQSGTQLQQPGHKGNEDLSDAMRLSSPDRPWDRAPDVDHEAGDSPERIDKELKLPRMDQDSRRTPRTPKKTTFAEPTPRKDGQLASGDAFMMAGPGLNVAFSCQGHTAYRHTQGNHVDGCGTSLVWPPPPPPRFMRKMWRGQQHSCSPMRPLKFCHYSGGIGVFINANGDYVDALGKALPAKCRQPLDEVKQRSDFRMVPNTPTEEHHPSQRPLPREEILTLAMPVVTTPEHKHIQELNYNRTNNLARRSPESLSPTLLPTPEPLTRDPRHAFGRTMGKNPKTGKKFPIECLKSDPEMMAYPHEQLLKYLRKASEMEKEEARRGARSFPGTARGCPPGFLLYSIRKGMADLPYNKRCSKGFNAFRVSKKSISPAARQRLRFEQKERRKLLLREMRAYASSKVEKLKHAMSKENEVVAGETVRDGNAEASDEKSRLAPIRTIDLSQLACPGIQTERPQRGFRTHYKDVFRKQKKAAQDKAQTSVDSAKTVSHVDGQLSGWTTPRKDERVLDQRKPFYEPLQLLRSGSGTERSQVYSLTPPNSKPSEARQGREAVNLHTVSVPKRGLIKLTGLPYEIDNPEVYDTRKESPAPRKLWEHSQFSVVLRGRTFQSSCPAECADIAEHTSTPSANCTTISAECTHRPDAESMELSNKST